MHSGVFLFLFSLIAIGVFCADWDIFQDSGSTSNDLTLALADTGGLDPFLTNEDPLTNINLNDLSTASSNPENSYTLFDSDDTSFPSLTSSITSSNLLANSDDSSSSSCSLLPPARRRMRARADAPTCSNPNYNNPIENPLSSTLDGIIYEGLQIPRLGRKITDYEDAEMRMSGQAYCPSHQIALPNLILPVCDSGIPGFTRQELGGLLFTVFNGFLITPATVDLCKPPRVKYCCGTFDDSLSSTIAGLRVTYPVASPCEEIVWWPY